MIKQIFSLLTLFSLTIAAKASMAQDAVQQFAPDIVGAAVPKQVNLQPAATPVMATMHAFHNELLWLITSIVAFVMILLLIVIFRFNEKAHPEPSQTTHNVPLEIIWTLVPVLILLVIAIPSFRLLFMGGRTPEAEMTLKVTGYQWYWGYEYPDNGDINFMSYLIKDNDIDKSKGQLRLLSTDNAVVLPTDTVIRIQVTASDVLHSFAVPAFGVKVDAVPGRLNESWVKITRPGVYFGQCSELCGTGHAFMPIEVHAVPKAEFAAWVASKGGKMPVANPDATLPGNQVKDAGGEVSPLKPVGTASPSAEVPADTDEKIQTPNSKIDPSDDQPKGTVGKENAGSDETMKADPATEAPAAKTTDTDAKPAGSDTESKAEDAPKE